jgi:hypothetical protein
MVLAQLLQRTNLTWPRPCLLRPWFRRFTVYDLQKQKGARGSDRHWTARRSRDESTGDRSYHGEGERGREREEYGARSAAASSSSLRSLRVFV